MIKVNPWFGFGWGTFPYIIRNYTDGGKAGTAHNMWLKVACEMGLVALALIMFMLFLFFKSAFYVYKREKDRLLRGMALGYMASIPAIVVCNFTGNRFDAVDLIIIFWLLSACILRLKDIIIKERIYE